MGVGSFAGDGSGVDMKDYSRRLVQVRLDESEKQSLGLVYIYEGTKEVFRCCSLELPWRDNRRNVSAIPAGRYVVRKRYTEDRGWHFHIQDVPGRSWILYHKGNFYRQIQGCVLVGSEFRDINGDGENDVINSAATLAVLLGLMPYEFMLDVVGV